MSRNLQDAIYDLIIDRIQNGARQSDLRQAYDDYMSTRNYNNPEMTELANHIFGMVEMEWDRCRDRRDEEDLISNAIDEGIAQHIGLWVTSDRKLANSVEDDNVYRDLQTAAGDWERTQRSIQRYLDGARDDRRGSYGRDDRGGRSNGFGGGSRSNGYGGNIPRGSGRDNRRDDRGSARLNSGFGSRQSRDEEDRRDRREQENRRIERDVRPRTDARSSSPLARSSSRNEEPVAPVEQQDDLRDQVIDQHAGPDFSLERPFDSFWDNGELWQLAAKATLVWKWSPKQQHRRTYNPDEEVCFLVQSADGTVREEFLPMTDDLQPFAHEIKAITRPFEERRVRSRAGEGQEISLPGEDIDAVDLDKLNSDVAEARRLVLISDLDVNKAHVASGPLVVGAVGDGLLGAARQRLKLDCDVASLNAMVAQVVPTSGKGLDALAQFNSLLTNTTDGGLDVLHKRFKALEGKLDESVMTLIDRHYTQEVNHLLKYAFEFGQLSIDSFLGDFPDLMPVIINQRSAAYAQHLLARTRNVGLSLVIETNPEIRTEVINAQDVLPENEDDNEAYQKFRENAVVAFRPSAVISVNVDAEAFGVLTDETRVPNKKVDSELADALVALYALGRRASTAGRVYLLTADNIELELVAEAGARDIVGVRRV